MGIRRFWIDAEFAVGREVSLPASVMHHAHRVLRLRTGDAVTLFNGRGGEAAARFDAEAHTAHIERIDPIERESPLAITLVQSWVINIKLDWVAEKLAELGGNRLILVPAARSVTRIGGERLRTRLDHLRAVVVSACCQSGRTRIPSVRAAESLEEGLRLAATDACAIMLAPNAEQSLTSAVGTAQRIALAVGPEGGFDDEEMALAARLGYANAHLGPRVLRTETAGLAAIAQLQVRFGDCG